MQSAFVLVLLLAAGCGDGCRQDPPIIIRFEPLADGDVAPAPRVLDGGAKANADLLHVATAPAKPEKAPTACTKDVECVVEPEDCCGCQQGGKQHAVHRHDVETKAHRESRCSDLVCAQVMSHDPSCPQKAACVKGTCALVPDAKAARKQAAPGPQ